MSPEFRKIGEKDEESEFNDPGLLVLRSRGDLGDGKFMVQNVTPKKANFSSITFFI